MHDERLDTRFSNKVDTWKYCGGAEIARPDNAASDQTKKKTKDADRQTDQVLLAEIRQRG